MRIAAPSRAGFSLRELLTVAMIVAGVLAVGVPALLTAERKAVVNW